MGRTKTTPSRKPQTGTIVGAAAISLLPASALFGGVEALGDTNASSSLSSASVALDRSSARSPSLSKRQSHMDAAIVTPSKYDEDTTKKSLKRRRFVRVREGRGGCGCEEDDDNITFDQSALSTARRKILDDDDDECVSSKKYERRMNERKKKRLRFADNVGDSKVKADCGRNIISANGSEKNDDDHKQGTESLIEIEKNCQLTIRDEGNVTVIGVHSFPPNPSFSTTGSYELMRYILPNSKVVQDHRENASNNVNIALRRRDVELMLQHCNQSSDADNSLDYGSIRSALENEMLEVVILCNENSHAVVSIRLLLASSLDKLSSSQLWLPPIPTPRRLPGSKSSCRTDPHPSYALMLALGAIFKGSIFDDIAKYLTSNPQQKKRKRENFITAKMVYKCVDNAHAEEFADERSSESTTSHLNIPGLVPTLRPYQEAAVRWMLRREGKCGDGADEPNKEWELCWYVVIEASENSGKTNYSKIMPLPEWQKMKSPPHERHIFVNPFAGWLASSYIEAKVMMLREESGVKGGILAESMGLGKSVEVLACILANSKVQFDERQAERGQSRTDILSNDSIFCQAKPNEIRDLACICGRSTSFPNSLSWVVCGQCKVAMHGRCAGFESEDELISMTKACSPVRECSKDKCPLCVASEIAQEKARIIESRATLIVTPPAILNQWQREISHHTKNPATGEPLKVAVYPGVQELCNAGVSSPHNDFQLVHPDRLSDADVVLVTFQALMADLGHSDDNPYAGFQKRGNRLRSRRRYAILPSPLMSIKWWRVCLDEAQRIEQPMTSSARMARKLKTDKRWCVSGTPIGRGRLEDLYGLLLFLSAKPFDDKRWFFNSFILSQGDVLNRLSFLLKDIMWRSTKANQFVRRQMGIPEQVEKKILLQFSSVEKYFYEKQYEETMLAAHRVMGSEDQRKSNGMGSEWLDHSLQKLRAACCHPQVGAGGVGGGGRVRRSAERVLSMNQILEKLVEEAKSKCEDAQRIANLHTIGLAGLTKLRAQSESNSRLLGKSIEIYEEVLETSNENASVTEAIGASVLRGSLGFCLNGHTINNGTATMVWKVQRSVDQTLDDVPECWSCINFLGTAKKICCLKIKARLTLPSNLSQADTGTWTVLRPRECILQMSSASAGGGFIDVCPFTLPANSGSSGNWTCVDKFYAKKSKIWRLVIKSYHDSPLLASEFYIGLDVLLFEPEINDDSLQRLHVLHNATVVLSSLIQADTGDAKEANNKLTRMESAGQAIQNSYMAHAQAIHRQSKHQLKSIVKARENCEKELEVMSKGSCRTWYEDALAWFVLNGDEQQQRNICEAVHHSLSNFYDNRGDLSEISELDQGLIRRGKFAVFHSVDGLMAALAMRIQQGEEVAGLRQGMTQTKCVSAVLDLSPVPSVGEIHENSHCRKCREDWFQTGPICSHCKLEEDLNIFRRLANDAEISCVLKTLSKALTDHLSRSRREKDRYLETLRQRSTKFFTFQEKLKEEILAAKVLWRVHFDLLSDIDELNQCKRAMRLRLEGEDISALTENEAAFIVDAVDIPAEMMDHEAKQASALAELRRNKDSLRYLKNQRAERQGTVECNICLALIDGEERSVLPCGHFFHPKCVDSLFKRNRGASIHCPMRCPMTIRHGDIFLASNKSKNDGSKTQQVEGDWGTKLNRLIGDVKDVIQIGDKGVIFSQWDEMLDILSEALKANNIAFLRPKSGRRFGEDIKRYRSSGCPILLMNIKNGAEGLTLTEANHIFMLEPILNCGLDSQAVNRVHRIGQTSKTYVHRYIVANTVEQKIDAIRIERQENHFEDDLKEQKKHSIKGGGIDGGFDITELHQLFR